MSLYPQTRKEMLRANYVRTGESECRDCGAHIEWWTTTHGRKLAFNPIETDFEEAIVHRATCTGGERRQQTSAKAFNAEREAEALCRRAGARVVVIVGEDGTKAAWKNGIPAEELRDNLISAANFVRNQIQQQEAAKR